MAQRAHSSKLPPFGISAAELGIYSYLKTHVTTQGIIPGGVPQIIKDLDYKAVVSKLASLKRKGFISYGWMQTPYGQELRVDLKELA